MPNSVRQLSIGQRFQLGILCEEFDQSVAAGYPRPPADERERAAVVAGTARIARYLADQGITCRQFTDDDKDDYRQAHFAAALLRHPHDYEPGTLAHDILAAAGLFPRAGSARGNGSRLPAPNPHPPHGERHPRSPRP